MTNKEALFEIVTKHCHNCNKFDGGGCNDCYLQNAVFAISEKVYETKKQATRDKASDKARCHDNCKPCEWYGMCPHSYEEYDAEIRKKEVNDDE